MGLELEHSVSQSSLNTTLSCFLYIPATQLTSLRSVLILSFLVLYPVSRRFQSAVRVSVLYYEMMCSQRISLVVFTCTVPTLKILHLSALRSFRSCIRAEDAPSLGDKDTNLTWKQFVNSVETVHLGAYVIHNKVAFCLCGILV